MYSINHSLVTYQNETDCYFLSYVEGLLDWQDVLFLNESDYFKCIGMHGSIGYLINYTYVRLWHSKG